MSATMPPGKPSLAQAEYVNITAFILQFNGAPAGAQALTPATATPIGTIATGQRAGHAAAAAARRRGGDGEGGAAAGRAAPRHRAAIRVAGEVKNYVPVTDAMLRIRRPATG